MVVDKSIQMCKRSIYSEGRPADAAGRADAHFDLALRIPVGVWGSMCRQLQLSIPRPERIESLLPLPKFVTFRQTFLENSY